MAITNFNLADLDGSNGFAIFEAPQDYNFGTSVSSAGDVNGDGFDDFIVGASGGLFGEPYSGYTHIPGSSYVAFGKASGFDSTIRLADLDGSNGFHLDNVEIEDYLGFSVSSAGDINGDGFDDVIVGALGSNLNGTLSGSSYVVFGKASGFDATINPSDLDGSNGFRLDGEENDRSGTSVSNAGDVNGDGIDDVIVGAFSAEPNGTLSGSSYVVFGKTSGFDARMNLSDLDGSNGFRLDGEENDRSGVSVSNAGDVNGDGIDDLIVGARAGDFISRYSGSGYVVFGKTSGFDATMKLSDLDGSNGFRLDEEKHSRSGFTVSNAGDVNGDGFDDVIVGEPRDDSVFGDPRGYNSGSSYVVFGKASGFDAVMNLSDLDGSNGFRLDGKTNDWLGVSVSAAGDVNGDGFDDVIIAAFSGSNYVVFGKASGFDTPLVPMELNGFTGFSGAEVSGAGDVNGDGFDDLIIGAPGGLYDDSYDQQLKYVPGYTYIVFGNSDFDNSDIQVDFIGTPGDDIFTGTSAAENFEGGAGNDRMIGRGGADSFDGGANDDTIRVSDLDFHLVDGGGGNDTLGLDGSGMNLVLVDYLENLVDFQHKITDIETIDLGSAGDNTLTLTVQDVIDISNSTNTLTVEGGADDHVIGLSSGWTDNGIQNGFRVFTQSSATVRIADAVDTDFVANGNINLSTLDGLNGFRLNGVNDFDSSGWSVSNAGDVNGDGFDDVIIGAPFANLSGNYSGTSYVVFGKAFGFNATMNLSGLDGTNGFRLGSGAAGDSSGWSVSNAGDVNGDGLDDVIIGAPGADRNGNNSGSSYVVFGRTSGFDAVMNLSGLDGTNGFRLDGGAADDFSGRFVSGAGDVNGDGFDDVIISVSNASSGGYMAGASYVVFGKAADFDATVDLSDLDGSDGFRLMGSRGGEVSTAGDVNGDGFDDLVIGFESLGSGISYVVFGKATGFDATVNLSDLDGSDGFRLNGESHIYMSVSTAGDVNGDGFDDVIVGITPGRGEPSGYVVFGKVSGFDATINLFELDGNNGFQLEGSDMFGLRPMSVNTAGDFNGDGFDDLIIGSKGDSYPGISYLVFGKASGFSAQMNLSDLDSSEGFQLTAGIVDDYLGASVSSAGDVNGDGFDDLIVGAPGVDPDGDRSGSSYVIFGRSSFVDDVDFPGTPGDDILTGTSAGESFVGGGGNDRMIGRGGADSFDGGVGNDYIRILGDDFQFVDGSTGTDTLGLAGSGFNLDLSSVIDKIHGIETISLYGVGDNTLTLTAQDVIDLSGETNTLKIKGNAGDSVVGLSSDWTDDGVHGNFHEYTNGEAVLLIGVDVTTDFA